MSLRTASSFCSSLPAVWTEATIRSAVSFSSVRVARLVKSTPDIRLGMSIRLPNREPPTMKPAMMPTVMRPQ